MGEMPSVRIGLVVFVIFTVLVSTSFGEKVTFPCDGSTCKTCIDDTCKITCKGLSCIDCPNGNCCSGSSCNICRNDVCCSSRQCTKCAVRCINTCETISCQNDCVINCQENNEKEYEEIQSNDVCHTGNCAKTCSGSSCIQTSCSGECDRCPNGRCCDGSNCNICHGGSCCQSSSCNSCFRSCRSSCTKWRCYDSCYNNCLKNSDYCGSGGCGSKKKIRIIQRAPALKNRYNVTTSINITNLINNTNEINNPIDINSTNYNSIHLKYNDTAESNETSKCCHIVHPIQCVDTINGKHCFRKRHKECSAICLSEYIHIVYDSNQLPLCHSIREYPYVYCGQYSLLQCDSCHKCGEGKSYHECESTDECPRMCKKDYIPIVAESFNQHHLFMQPIHSSYPYDPQLIQPSYYPATHNIQPVFAQQPYYEAPIQVLPPINSQMNQFYLQDPSFNQELSFPLRRAKAIPVDTRLVPGENSGNEKPNEEMTIGGAPIRSSSGRTNVGSFNYGSRLFALQDI